MPRAASPRDDFSRRLIAWQRRHGRKGLPWQGTRDPYRIWLSEVMLQQTQVAAVIPYYERFVRRFPDVFALAAASQEDVLQLWSGLGYYARGRNLHLAAGRIVSQYGGEFPRTAQRIEELPGIGRSTAAAVAAFAFGRRGAILDGNVKRVLARCYGIAGWPGAPAVEARLWELAEKLLPKRGIEIYTQALMDLGATLCTRAKPRCDACPVTQACVARRKNLVEKIPAPRAKKALPQRSATWLVLRHAGQILLERRPGSGLWGGLWTFPESPARDIAAYCRHALGCEIARPRRLAPLEHAFTHFRLRIRPLVCEVSSIGPRAEMSARLWIDAEEAAAAAVPAPVKKLLRRLAG
jgi:A/G-specific adenine glycosylase